MVRAGQPDPRRAARRRSRRSASSPSRAAKQRARARAARDAPHPGQLRAGRRSSRRARRTCSRRAARIAVDERTNVLIARDVAGNLEPDRGARPLARHADAAGAHRGAHRRGDEPLPPRRRHPVGRRRAPSRRRPATRPASPSRRAIGIAGGASDQQHADRRPLAVPRTRSRTRTSRSTCRPTVGTGQRRRDRPHARLDQQHRQPRPCASRPPSRAACCASSRARASSRSTTARRASARAR